MSKQKLNLKRLSEVIGVAPCTISRVLNGQARKYRISEKTEQKVLRKARELGYKPNYFAQSMNIGRTYTIGVVFANTVDAYLGSIMEGLESELRNTEYQMVVATCENSPEIEHLEIDRMLHRKVDGIIIYPSAMPLGVPYPTKHLAQPRDKFVPYVVIGRQIDLPTDHILFDDYAAGKAAAERLLAAGCKRFGFASLPIECKADQDRENGFIQTLRENGVPADAITVIGAREKITQSQIAKLAKVDGIFGVNASVVIDCAHGLQPTRSIADMHLELIGDMPAHLQLDSHLQIQPMPARQMGGAAARQLLKRMKEPDAAPETIRLPWPPPHSDSGLP